MASGFEWPLGTLLAGIFFNTYLFGVVSYQFGVYFNTEFNDPLWIKAIVLLLCVTDTFHSAAVIYMAWDYCVTNFSNPSVFMVAPWPYPFTPIATAITAAVTHNFLGYRIYKLTNNKLIYGTIILFSLLSFSLGIACGVGAWIIHEISGLAVLQPIVAVWLGVQTGLDVVISSLLAWFLYRSRTGISSTDTIIRRLMRGAIQTGCFASVFAMGDLFAFLLSTSNLYGMFAIPLGRIYTNTLMDTLIMRRDLRGVFKRTNDINITSSGTLRESTTPGQTLRSNMESAISTRHDDKIDQTNRPSTQSALADP